jgi:cell division protein FtsL
MLLIGILSFVFVLGGYHLYSVNQSAVQGYHMRSVEKDIATLKQENTDLKIKEADLRSLNRIEEAGAELEMQKTGEERYLETRGPVAMR